MGHKTKLKVMNLGSDGAGGLMGIGERERRREYMENRQDVLYICIKLSNNIGAWCDSVHFGEAGGCLGFTGQKFYLKKQDGGCSVEHLGMIFGLLCPHVCIYTPHPNTPMHAQTDKSIGNGIGNTC